MGIKYSDFTHKHKAIRRAINNDNVDLDEFDVMEYEAYPIKRDYRIADSYLTREQAMKRARVFDHARKDVLVEKNGENNYWVYVKD